MFRKTRKSERLLARLWLIMPRIIVAVWFPMRTDAIKHCNDMKKILDKVIIELEKEEKENKK